MNEKIINITLSGDTKDITKGLSYLTGDLSVNITSDGYPIRAIKADSPTLEINADGQGAVITFFEKCQFFRAMGLLLEHLRDGETVINIKESPRFTMNGAMFDVSQSCNCIKDPRYLFRKMAIMGLNMFMFGCEDSFVVENEPYFGYMRPRYTEDELRAFVHR